MTCSSIAADRAPAPVPAAPGVAGVLEDAEPRVLVAAALSSLAVAALIALVRFLRRERRGAVTPEEAESLSALVQAGWENGAEQLVLLLRKEDLQGVALGQSAGEAGGPHTITVGNEDRTTCEMVVTYRRFV